MADEEKCCGTGACLINAQGLCWCGQQWDGEKMCRLINETDHSLNLTENVAKVARQDSKVN